MSTLRPSALRGTRRRWLVPPAPPHDEEVFEALVVLDETNGEAGIVLWQTLRDVMLWARAAGGPRGALFAAGATDGRMAALLAASLPPGLEAPLARLATLVADPVGVPEEAVSLACREVALWLEESGRDASALPFAHAASVAAPGDPVAALVVGRLARRAADHPRADRALRRAVVLARQCGDWVHHARALLALGSHAMERGNLPAARRFALRGLRSAERRDLPAQRSTALHDLFAVSAHAGDVAAAGHFAALATRAYGPGHPRLPMLAHDVAWFWVTQGWFGRALPVLRSLLPHFGRASDRAVVLSLTARAAAGVGDGAEFEGAWTQTLAALDEGEGPRTAGVLLELAHGALTLGAWDRAEGATARALDLATQRGEARARLTAEALLDAARRGRAARRRPPLPPVEGEGAPEELMEALVTGLRAAPAAG